VLNALHSQLDEALGVVDLDATAVAEVHGSAALDLGDAAVELLDPVALDLEEPLGPACRSSGCRTKTTTSAR
jgi:hypothetical protein